MNQKLVNNKRTAIDFYTTMVNKQAPIEAYDKYCGFYYRQHNAYVSDGREGFLEHFEMIKKELPHTDVAIRALADDDMVVLHILHEHPPVNFPEGEPCDYSKYGMVSFDMFRFSEDGKIIEHWDSVQWPPFPRIYNVIENDPGQVSLAATQWWPDGQYKWLEAPISNHSMIDGETEIKDLDKTAANKSLVRSFVEKILIEGRMDTFENYFGDTLIQHIQRLKDGVEEYRQAIANMDKDPGLRYIMDHRVIAEGNFVYVHSQVNYRGKVTTMGDLFRVEDGKIVEIWECLGEAVPELLPHTNGLF